MYPHFNRIGALTCGYKQRVPIRTAKADVACPRLFDIDVLYPLSGLIEYSNSIPRKVDVAFAVDRHPVRTQLAEQFLVRDRSILLDIVNVGLLALDVGYSHRVLPLGSSNDAVRLGQVAGNQRQFALAWRQVVYSLAILLYRAAMPVIALVVGVRQIHAAIRSDPDVVGAVQQLALITGDYNGILAIRRDTPERILFIRARPQVSVRIETRTVRSPARLHKSGDFAV